MKLSLSKKEISLFQLVSKTIFTNPFSEERNIADAALAGCLTNEHNPAKLLQLATDRVAKKIHHMEKENKSSLHSYTGEDRRLLGNVYLFHIFHRHVKSFDSHIEQQLQQGNTPTRFAAGNTIVTELLECGFSGAEAQQYLAVFFQMRRAFYFIRNSLLGISPCMTGLRESLWNNIFTRNIGIYVDSLMGRMEDFSTLLLGETGTGKGAAAFAVGCSGFIPYDNKKQRFCESFTKAFLSINLSQFSEQLIESELFGHARGSFTGAVKEHSGVFYRSSQYGAVFLDEIGEISIPIQIKLLKILQERTFSQVGSDTEQRFSGRVIAATNQSLTKLRHQSKFRDDFYYRLCSDTIVIPPLRQRIKENPEEIKLLTGHLLERITGKSSASLLSSVLKAIRTSLPRHYSWHGNVRELEQCIRQILIKGTYAPIQLEQGPSPKAGQLGQLLENGSMDMSELTRRYCTLLYEKLGTYQEVARRTGLDRRTVKKYINEIVEDDEAG
ncbi:MAG: sigma 54-interacting transcriptional regulator [Desulfobulbaceae bacterium]|nr:sigma 54-interacting transcriptional regulator [Desulfobulbaceae bacterium]